MRRYSLPVNLLIALVAVVIIGSTLDIVDATFGSHISPVAGIWLAGIASVLLVAYFITAFNSRKK